MLYIVNIITDILKIYYYLKCDKYIIHLLRTYVN
jgi:hypothetical protein